MSPPSGRARGANFYLHRSAAVLVSRWINVKPILETCCGLDVHRDQVTACIASGPLDRAKEKLIVKEFSTMTYDFWRTVFMAQRA